MRNILKTTAILSTFALTLAGGCEAQKEPVTFVVNCDYGMHIQGKASLLLSGSTFFFEPEEYGIGTFVIGDEVIVEHSGELYVLESYPSRVVLQDGDIKSVTVNEAEILCVTYDGASVKSAGGERFTNELPLYVIQDVDGTFAELKALKANTTLYATYREEQTANGAVKIEGLYAYNPR